MYSVLFGFLLICIDWISELKLYSRYLMLHFSRLHMPHIPSQMQLFVFVYGNLFPWCKCIKTPHILDYSGLIYCLDNGSAVSAPMAMKIDIPLKNWKWRLGGSMFSLPGCNSGYRLNLWLCHVSCNKATDVLHRVELSVLKYMYFNLLRWILCDKSIALWGGLRLLYI